MRIAIGGDIISRVYDAFRNDRLRHRRLQMTKVCTLDV